MTNIFRNLKTISATIGFLAVIFGICWAGVKIYDRIFTSVEKRIEAESLLEKVDLKKVYKVSVLDSINEVRTKEWRNEQEKKDVEMNKKLVGMDSLLRLNVFLTSKSIKKNDTLNMNVEHALDHVDN